MAPNICKSHPLLKMINNSLIDLPAPSNTSAWWNFGSITESQNCLGWK